PSSKRTTTAGAREQLRNDDLKPTTYLRPSDGGAHFRITLVQVLHQSIALVADRDRTHQQFVAIASRRCKAR
ncbi:MAG: hypothetical protein ABI389_09225, partial [Rhodanobacter sp.]